MQSALSAIDDLITNFDEEVKLNDDNNDENGDNMDELITNCNEIKCNKCNGTLLQIETATSLQIGSIKIHGYNGKNMENVNKFWVVDKLTKFENVSVSRPVNFGNGDEINHIISMLLGETKEINNMQLRYLMCSGPPMDLSALFGGNANKEQKQNLQKLLSTPQICEKLIIGCAIFEGKDYKTGYIVQNRVKH